MVSTAVGASKLISTEFTEQLITSDSQKTVALKDLPSGLTPIPQSERTFLQWENINYFVPTDGKDPTRQAAEESTNSRI